MQPHRIAQPWTSSDRSTSAPAGSSIRFHPDRRVDAGHPAHRPVLAPRETIHLAQLLDRAANRWPDRVAVETEAGQTLTYAQLDHAADRLDARLARYGVGRGDRVGLMLPKSLEAVAAIHGILRAGAAYVPVDATAPVARGAGILADAFVKTIVIHASLVESLRSAWAGPGPLPKLIVVGETTDDDCATWDEVMADEAPTPDPSPRFDGDVAYILYTSGSTGTPKGVTLTHQNALSFLDWCVSEFGQEPGRRFASHAPFHFDLSVFDLYASCRAGGTLVLVSEGLGKDPVRLGDFLAERQIDVWYSAPSILGLMAEFGRLDRPGFPVPSLVLFAGEVFPITQLKRLRKLWPSATLWNLYGPTETNVCTAYRIPASIADDRTEAFPIGPVCPPLQARVVDEQGDDVPEGDEGELLIAGPGVMRGYFGRDDLTESAFIEAPDGTLWYRTGDLVADIGGGCFAYHGRRDRMVKKRGYRIELGEIEAALDRLDGISRAAVVAVPGDAGLTITAFVAMKPGQKASIIAVKRHCTAHLPTYMIPDAIRFLPVLPSTSTDKIDYPRLITLVSGEVSSEAA
ncbi:amino acid adenylation domain-containing protein [Tautonia marina]|uniref:amino acid adenylation domain-containing protein n=1 Tax=Tautonia marina TaxID=2653855 RepID=UPI001260A8C0|nr:amino acid adenylation domain-containing protein [Tautonia marina]